MKRLLLGVMFATLCMSDASAALFQSKASKNNVNMTLQNTMGRNYKGMVSLAHSLSSGWAEAMSYSMKDPDFAVCKNDLKNAKNSFVAIAKFTKALLERQKESSINSNAAKAQTALASLNTAIMNLRNSIYWQSCGAQLRYSVIVIVNTLRALSYKDVEFNAAGAKCSAERGLIDGTGNTIATSFTSIGLNFGNTAPSSASTYNLLNSSTMLLNNVESAVVAVNPMMQNTMMGTPATSFVPTTTVNATPYGVAPGAAPAGGSRRR